MNKELKCVCCGENLTECIGVQKEYINNKIVQINNTPMVECKSCLKTYIPPYTMDKINEIVSYYNNKINEGIYNDNNIIETDYIK